MRRKKDPVQKTGAHRGNLKAVNRLPTPTYNPHEVLDVWYETRRQESLT